ncbi:uncharacterized protein LOC127799729 [Diospyros lotus]|uniref:uncharacterized protein LOC127799729 n=1 Tax=Diospyros lotus TaxID=55363 RepID=UPI0022580E05|nr:uncharacterized protein LOC127799729 [Diospyros lotus]
MEGIAETNEQTLVTPPNFDPSTRQSCAVCEDAPISCKRWEDVSQDNKNKMYSYVLEKFEFEENEVRKNWILRKMGRAFANHRYRLKADYYDAYDNDDDQIKFAPTTVDQGQWRQVVTWLSSHEFQVACARNKSNRSKQTMTITTGTRSFARVRAEQAEILGLEPSAWEMFKVTPKKKDGSMVDSMSKQIVDKIQSLVTQRAEEGPSQAIDENEICSEVMGRERHGRVHGYGFRPTPSSVPEKIPSCNELITELEQMR